MASSTLSRLSGLKIVMARGVSLLAIALAAGCGPALAADDSQDWDTVLDVVGYPGIATTKDWGWVMVGGPVARAEGFTGKGVVVGVVDTGIDFSHSALAGRDFSYNYGSYVPGDNHPHATHVAGIIGGTDIGAGMQGVAPGVTFSSLQIFTGAAGAYVGDANVAQAYDGAINSGVRIFNNSWGNGPEPIGSVTKNYVDTAYSPLVAAFHRAVAADAVLVWSTGNDSQSQPNVLGAGLPHYYPELKSNWLAVTAVGPTGTIAYYANACGVAKAWCLAAPGGSQLYNNDPDGIYSTVPGNGYEWWQGTSMAAPYVTGAVAVAREMFPRATGAELAQLVLMTSRDIGVAGIDDLYGWGLLAVDNLVETIDPRGSAMFANSAWGRFNTLSQIGNTVMDRMSDQRAGRSDVTTGPLAFAGPALAFDKVATSAFPSAKVRDAYAADPAAQPAAKWSPVVWGRALFGSASLSAGPVSSGASVDVSGGLIGVDLISAPGVLLGVAGGGTTTNVNSRATADSADATAWHILGYGAVEYGPAFLSVAGGWSRFDQSYERHFIPGTIGSVFASTGAAALASSNDDAYFVQGRAGWAFLTTIGRVEPYLHAATRNQSLGGFSEINASVFNLSVPSTDLSETEYGAGVRWASAPIAVASGLLSVAPTVDLAYVRFDNDGPIEVRTDLLGTTIVGETTSLGADGVRVGSGLAITVPNGLVDGFVGYTGTFRDGATAHAFSGGVSVRF